MANYQWIVNGFQSQLEKEKEELSGRIRLLTLHEWRAKRKLQSGKISLREYRQIKNTLSAYKARINQLNQSK